MELSSLKFEEATINASILSLEQLRLHQPLSFNEEKLYSELLDNLQLNEIKQKSFKSNRETLKNINNIKELLDTSSNLNKAFKKSLNNISKIELVESKSKNEIELDVLLKSDEITSPKKLKIEQKIVEIDLMKKKLEKNKDFLRELNYTIYRSIGDGNCLIHSINSLLQYNNIDEIITRRRLINYINLNKDRIISCFVSEDMINEELVDLNTDSEWLSITTIFVVCNMFNIDILIINQRNTSIFYIPYFQENSQLSLIGALYYNGSNHWDWARPNIE